MNLDSRGLPSQGGQTLPREATFPVKLLLPMLECFRQGGGASVRAAAGKDSDSGNQEVKKELIQL